MHSTAATAARPATARWGFKTASRDLVRIN